MVVDALRQREPDAAVVELLHLWTTTRCSLDYFHFDDLFNENYNKNLQLYLMGQITLKTIYIITKIKEQFIKHGFFPKFLCIVLHYRLRSKDDFSFIHSVCPGITYKCKDVF